VKAEVAQEKIKLTASDVYDKTAENAEIAKEKAK
jgi:hypothetical protein